MLGERNPNAFVASPERISTGIQVDQLRGFELARDSETKANGFRGLHELISKRDAEQYKQMRDAGVTNPPILSPDMAEAFDVMERRPYARGGRYMEVAEFYAGNTHTASNIAADLADYDKRVAELREKHPDMTWKSSKEIVDEAIGEGRAAEEAYMHSKGGNIGGFVGGMVGSLDPVTNPLNFGTMFVGGGGKTVATRMTTAGGAQGVVETINQLTGVDKQRELMGLEHGTEQIISRVGLAAAGGVGAQGVGEGVGYLARMAKRKWFTSTPDDPAPLPEQLLLEYKPMQEQPRMRPDAPRSMGDRMMDGRAFNDAEQVIRRLQTWDAENPSTMIPRTMSAIPTPVDGVEPPKFDIDIHDPGKNLDEIARLEDPDTFRVYDKLADDNATYRRWLNEMKPNTKAQEKLHADIADLNDKIDNAKRTIRRHPGAKKAEALRDTVAKMEQERDTLAQTLVGKDTPEMARVRERLLKNDLKMRDLSPAVSRAYARAKSQWELGAEERELFRQMVRDGNKNFPQSSTAILNDTYENTAARFASQEMDRMPIMQEAHKVEATMKKGADAADYAQAIIKHNNEAYAESLEKFRTSLDAIIKEKDGTLNLDGQDYKFHLDNDKVIVPNEDGEGSRTLTIRQFLEEQAETEFDLKAITTCAL